LLTWFDNQLYEAEVGWKYCNCLLQRNRRAIQFDRCTSAFPTILSFCLSPAVSMLTIYCLVFYSFPVRHAGQHYKRLFLSKRNDHAFFLRGLGIISLSSRQTSYRSVLKDIVMPCARYEVPCPTFFHTLPIFCIKER
jgi:hypothetical protein